MKLHEVNEHIEHAHGQQQKNIGLTTAVVAVLLAFVTMLANDANTKKIVIETRTADWWAYAAYHDTNARIYMTSERLAQLHGESQAAKEFHTLYEEQKKDSEDAKVSAQGEEYNSGVQSRHALYAEVSGLCLEVSIVLCSVALLSGLKLFWRISFLSTLAGAGLIAALFLH